MRSQRKGGLSAITKVKVFSPVITNIAQGQGFHFLEASTAACVSGECVGGVPGSKSMAGNPTVHIGTWENHIAPARASQRSAASQSSNGSFQQAEEARRKYGDVVVGLTHSRGVVGVMPGESQRAGTLEGVSSKTQRDE